MFLSPHLPSKVYISYSVSVEITQTYETKHILRAYENNDNGQEPPNNDTDEYHRTLQERNTYQGTIVTLNPINAQTLKLVMVDTAITAAALLLGCVGCVI